MGADRDVGLILLQHPDERPSVKLVECELNLIGLARLVMPIIQPTEHLRHPVDRLDIRL